MYRIKKRVYLAGLMLLMSCQQDTKDVGEVDTAETKQFKHLDISEYDLAKQALLGNEFEVSTAKAVQEYKNKLVDALSDGPSVLALDQLDERPSRAQSLFLEHPGLERYLQHPQSKETLRVEVMSVSPVLPSNTPAGETACAKGQCFEVMAYNFFDGSALQAIVDIEASQIKKFSVSRDSQPDLSERLAEVAKAIAYSEPLVKLEIEKHLERINQEASGTVAALMASTKSSLNNTFCERSRHLCVAPTFVLGSQALWVIVDLTDFKIAGLRWTNVGDSSVPAPITERKLENEHVFERYCEQVNNLTKGDWSLNYQLTSSDGLRIGELYYQGNAVLKSAKVVDWHVSYSKFDGFGYSDATGCPMFSSAVVVAHEGPSIEPIVLEGKEVGFALTQDFRQLPWPAPCNYRYKERYEFYNDGRYRVALSNLGRGCGSNGTYRPVLRLELPPTPHVVQKYDSGSWKNLEREEWSPQMLAENMYHEEYSHRILMESGAGYLMAPSRGQFGDGGRGDNAFIYTTINHEDKDEGQTDLVTLGSCCNTDYQQGPELFMQPAEEIQDQPLVMWYVAQLDNDGGEGNQYCWAETKVVDGVRRTKTWPCTAGPMFTPFKPSVSDTPAH